MGTIKQFFTGARSTFAVVVALLFLHGNMVDSAQNTSNSQDLVTDNGHTVRPIDEGMRPLYEMTNFFLGNIVQPQSFEELRIDIVKLQKDPALVLQDWTMWAKYFVGYLVCIAIGILFIVVMPIVGFCFCCCRCCCSRKVNPMDSRHAKYKRISCGTFLFIITTVILAGTVCTFMANELIRQQTGEPYGMLPTIDKSLATIDNYKDNTIVEMVKAVNTSLQTGIQNIKKTLLDIPKDTLDELGEITNATTLLQAVDDLAKSLATMKDSLQNVTTSVANLKTTGDNLESQLSTVRNDVSNTLQTCSAPQCTDIRKQLDQMKVLANFSQKVDDVSSQLDDVKKVSDANLPKLIDEGKENFQNITNKIMEKAKTEINKAGTEVDYVLKTAKTATNQVVETVNQYNLNATRHEIRKAEPLVREYGQYCWYGGIALSCILLLIVLLNYMGLSFGACGERPYDDATICNKGVGSNLLMAGVGFSFIFCWILMLITMILFLIGGILHTEICRYAVNPENSAATNVMSDVIEQQLNISVNISNVLMGCKKNQPIYVALDLESIVHLKDKVNLQKFNLSGTIDQITTKTVDLNDITILTPEADKQLENLKNAGLEKINFTTFLMQLNKNLTGIDLTSFATELDSAAVTINQTGDTTKAKELAAQAEKLRTIQNTLVSKMAMQENNLKSSIETLQKLTDSGNMDFQQKIGSLITHLNDTQNKIRTSGNDLLKQALNTTLVAFLTATQKSVNSLIDKVTTSVGKCLPLYQALSSSVNSVCVSFLYPLNGFWFSVGWCLFFFIPCIIFSVKLAGMYRKTEPYDPYAIDKSFDDPYHRNYDAYQGVYPGDHIPLEEVDNKKNYRNGQGVHNRGYESGDNQGAQPNYHRNAPGYPHNSRGYGGGDGGGSGHSGGANHHQGNGAPSTTPSPPNPPYHYNTRPQYY